MKTGIHSTWQAIYTSS